MTDALRGPTGELRALPRRRSSEHDDEIDTDALEVKTKDGTVFATVDPAPLRQIVQQSFDFFRGPLPPPDLLEQYERVLPGAAKFIFDSYAEVQAHEQSMEERQIAMEERQIAMEEVQLRGDLRKVQRGQYLGFIVVIVVMVAAFVLVLTGHDAAGATIAAIDLVGLATIFVIGRFTDRQAESQPKEGSTQSQAPEPGR